MSAESAFPTTVPALVRASAAQYRDLDAVVDGEVSLSFGDLAVAVQRSAGAAIAQGIRPGDRVALWAPNTYRWVLAALGLLSLGAVLVPLNTRYRGREAAELIRRTGARALMVHHGFLDYDYIGSVLAATSGSTSLEVVVDMAEQPAESDLAVRILGWQRYLDAGVAAGVDDICAAGDAVSPDDLSEIIFTSGTTGPAKGVMLTHGPSLRLYRDYGSIWGFRAGDRNLVSLPFFHTGGLKAGLIACLIHGVTIVPLAAFDTDAALDMIARQRISVMTGPPTVFASILDHPRRDTYDLSSLRLAATGAAVVPTTLVERMRSELPFENVITAYGLSESCGTVTMCRHTDSAQVVAQTNGAALPGVDVKIVRADGTCADPDESGEVVVRGYNITQGYWDDPAATAAAIDPDGWLHTGDIGALDSAGNLKITDRLKDLYIVGGFNVSPAEVEQVLATHPDLSEVAVIGVPDDRLGEVGKAFVVPKPGRTVDEAVLIKWCRGLIANFKAPRSISVLDALPRNASGKVLRRELRDADHAATGRSS
ncbi:FadD3 family acyl-CoA ligase [Mycobacterium sp. 94-17]|uniref:FadD3 family acyl-CoA ligase n=1 Tax=Mycobacterium sp. 94-17 TaxID=2986147 RepID=UPI002D1F7388|nr:FadD3 family acyl-CoA ligase [Mycobacterium sp. 94-17]MEB4209746.1 FadD3 family acyl-CoA ligase [Mycobacterium sp. 94-17]